MESARHERVVIRCVAENNEFDAADGILILCKLRCIQDDISQHTDRIHINTGFGRTDIDGAADEFSLGKCLRNGFDQHSVCRRHSL